MSSFPPWRKISKYSRYKVSATTPEDRDTDNRDNPTATREEDSREATEEDSREDSREATELRLLSRGPSR